MATPSYSVLFSAILVATIEDVAIGRGLVLVEDATGFDIATEANRTAAGRRSAGIARSVGDAQNRAVEIQMLGMVPAEATLLGAGAATYIRMSATGWLERVASPTAADDVVGRCDVDGVAYLYGGAFASAVAGEANTASNVGAGAGLWKDKVLVDLRFRSVIGGINLGATQNANDVTLDFEAPSGTGFAHVTGGQLDAAATANFRYASGQPQSDTGYEFKSGANLLDLVATPTGARTVTIQDATQTLVGRDTTDTLTNKTLVSPIVTGTPVYQGTRVSIPSTVTEVQTAAITQVNCGTYTITDEHTVAIDVIVRSQRRTSNTKRGCWKFSAVVSRNGAGAVLDVLTVGDAFNLNAGTVTCDVNGNDFRVRITPADTDARNWDSEIRAQDGTAA